MCSKTISHRLLKNLSPPTAVYIEPEVVGPGPKANFEVDPRSNKSETMANAFDKFMASKANVLLLSGPAGSGKSTAYAKLQTWVLSEYTTKRKKEVSNTLRHRTKYRT